jgi:hypothetical protein
VVYAAIARNRHDTERIFRKSAQLNNLLKVALATRSGLTRDCSPVLTRLAKTAKQDAAEAEKFCPNAAAANAVADWNKAMFERSQWKSSASQVQATPAPVVTPVDAAPAPVVTPVDATPVQATPVQATPVEATPVPVVTYVRDAPGEERRRFMVERIVAHCGYRSTDLTGVAATFAQSQSEEVNKLSEAALTRLESIIETVPSYGSIHFRNGEIVIKV